MQDRTHELREVQKYLKRFEKSIMVIFLKKFENILARLDHDRLSLESYI